MMPATSQTTRNNHAPPITWLSVQVAATHVGRSRRTIYNWLTAGKLHWRRAASGCVLIDEASLWESYSGPRVPWVPVGKGVYERRSTNLLNRQTSTQATRRELRTLLTQIAVAVEVGSSSLGEFVKQARELLAR